MSAPNPIENALLRVLQKWANVTPDSFGIDKLLSDMWIADNGPEPPFDPDGIHKLKDELKNDPLLGNCQLVHDLDEGLFADGGAIQTVGDLLEVLAACSAPVINEI